MNINEMWQRLAQHQSYADQRGYGEAWAKMCAERTKYSANFAARQAAHQGHGHAAHAAETARDTVAAAEETAEYAIQWIEVSEEEYDPEE
jgi:hypothetical protein